MWGMTDKRASTVDPPSASVERDTPVIESSTLLPLMFAPLDPLQRAAILDVGPATPQTLAFCSSLKCRLHIADLHNSSIVEDQYSLDQDALANYFTKALFMIDGPLDICLLWDFPNRLTVATLKAFNSVLSRFIKPTTLAHAFCSVKRVQPLMQHRYAVLKANQILRRIDPDLKPAAHPHTQKELENALGAFQVERGALRVGGRVEVTLHPNRHEPR